jgi:hypothetical protein
VKTDSARVCLRDFVEPMKAKEFLPLLWDSDENPKREARIFSSFLDSGGLPFALLFVALPEASDRHMGRRVNQRLHVCIKKLVVGVARVLVPGPIQFIDTSYLEKTRQIAAEV